MKIKAIILLSFSLVLFSCGNEGNSSKEPSTNKKDAVQKSDDREQWQNPYEVLNLWNEQLKGKRIMEIGSNDGYWTLKLAKAGALVTAADFSETRLEALMDAAEDAGLQDMIETRLITTEDPMLQPDEMDHVWAINTYSTLPDRVGFFAKVHQGIKIDGQLVLIDWVDTQTPHGPPLMDRIGAMAAMDEMDAAGFMDVSVRTNLLPEQWIMVAQNVPPEAYQ